MDPFRLIMRPIGSIMNLLFFLIIAVTVVGSIWLSRKYKERFAEFPWFKAAILIAAEVVAWIVFNWVWSNPWLVAIIAVIAVIALIILVKRKKREEQIL